MTKSTVINRSNTHGHTAVLYESIEERSRLLATYFKEGVEQGNLCVFVSSETESTIIEQFKHYGFDATDAIRQGSLRIFQMRHTYLPGGKFVNDYMIHNLEGYLADAEMHGYSGLRTAGEMSWLTERPEELNEAMEYEASVNKLSEANDNFIGLCLFPVEQTFAEMLNGVLSTHPTAISGSQLQSSLYHE